MYRYAHISYQIWGKAREGQSSKTVTRHGSGRMPVIYNSTVTKLSSYGVPQQVVVYLRQVQWSVHQTLYHHRAWEISECLLMRNSLCALCTHVQRTVSRCFTTLRQLRGIRSSVPQSMFQSLVTTLDLNRLDYCNSVLVGLLANLTKCLQSVQNAAARLIFQICRSEHITNAFIDLHWLRVPKRVIYKVAILTYRVLNGSAPCYLSLQCRAAWDSHQSPRNVSWFPHFALRFCLPALHSRWPAPTSGIL